LQFGNNNNQNKSTSKQKHIKTKAHEIKATGLTG